MNNNIFIPFVDVNIKLDLFFIIFTDFLCSSFLKYSINKYHYLKLNFIIDFLNNFYCKILFLTYEKIKFKIKSYNHLKYFKYFFFCCLHHQRYLKYYNFCVEHELVYTAPY